MTTRPTSPPPPRKRPKQIVIQIETTVTPEYEQRLQRLFEENARLQTELEDITDQRDDLKRTIREIREQYGE